jgi:hypothetical protein
MTATPNWRSIAPQTIYRAYPDSDLLPIDPPAAGEAIGDFAVRAEGAGDTLFLFLCREANDEIDAEEYLERLHRARRDIDAVCEAFEGLVDNPISQPQSAADSRS